MHESRVMVLIIDYGMGNLRSVEKAFQKIGAETRVSDKPADIKAASSIVVPGVGAFDHAVKELRARGLFEPIQKAVREGKPYLGLCLGLQLLFEKSEEGKEKGFGFLPGRVVRFDGKLKTPHMGWNTVQVTQNSPNGLWDGIGDCPYYYFVHSYYVECTNAADVMCSTGYGLDFTSAVCSKNIIATQFHPEKSQENGLKFLKNYMTVRS